MILKISKQFGKKIFALTACLFTAAFVFAQEEAPAEPVAEKEDVMVLTVEDAVNYAAEHSLTLKTSALDLELAKWKNNTSWNTFLPNLQVTGSLARSNDPYSSLKLSGTYNSMLPAPEEKDRWSVVGNLGVSFNFNAAMIMSMISAKESYESGKITYEQAVRSNEDSIRKLFYALLLQQESLKLQKDSLENARQRMNQASANYRNGYVPQIQYLQAQVAYENQIPAVEKAELSMLQ